MADGRGGGGGHRRRGPRVVAWPDRGKRRDRLSTAQLKTPGRMGRPPSNGIGRTEADAILLSAGERTLRARIAAHAMHAQHDSRETSAAARVAFDARFLDEVDPDRQLPEVERLRRAGHARKAYFARLA